MEFNDTTTLKKLLLSGFLPVRMLTSQNKSRVVILGIWTARYRNDPKFSDRYAWANSADPDQTAPSSLIRVYTACHSVCIVWTHYTIHVVEQHSSKF